MMLTISVKKIAPSSAPEKDPRPPESAAPPSTAAAMLVSALVGAPGSSLLSFGIIAAGVPAYYLWRRGAG